MNEERKRFCLKCQRVVKDSDIGAVELQRGAGIICGEDVDKLIAEIYVPSARTIAWQRMPERFRPRSVENSL